MTARSHTENAPRTRYGQLKTKKAHISVDIQANTTKKNRIQANSPYSGIDSLNLVKMVIIGLKLFKKADSLLYAVVNWYKFGSSAGIAGHPATGRAFPGMVKALRSESPGPTAIFRTGDGVQISRWHPQEQQGKHQKQQGKQR
ncbi:MAG: hypothetical protein ACC631_03110 [Halocynthiibacter sp.]